MEQKPKTIELPHDEQIAITIAMHDYLVSVVPHIKESIRVGADRPGYHPESNIAASIRVYNRATNLQLGSHVNYDVDRVPTFLANALR